MSETRYDRTRDKTVLARKLRREASKTEQRLWPHLRNSRMGAPFRKQHPIGEHFADYCCVPLMLVVEVDGPLHDKSSDAKRDADMIHRGFDILRFPVQQLDEEFNAVIEAIHGAVQDRLLRERFARADGK